MGATLSQLIACAWDRHRQKSNTDTMAPHKKSPTTEATNTMMSKRKETEMASVTTQEVDMEVESMKHKLPSRSVPDNGLARIYALTPIQTLVFNPQLELLEISNSYLKHSKLKREDVVGKSIYDFAATTKSGVDRQTIMRAVEQAVREKERSLNIGETSQN